MHLFFDTVWKLHIGEIPEKPKYRNFEKVGRITLHDTKKYNEAIAAIKQNALTVGNPEFLESHFWCGKFEHLNLIEIPPPPDKFYFWPGGYYVDMWNAAPRDEPSEPDEVAILTLPEEEKNTMENMKKALELARTLPCACSDCGMRETESAKKILEFAESLSGSVAAPKPKTEGRWFKDWKKITEAVIPKGPMCRDCADQDGTCPNNDGLPCDPTDEVIERFKRLRQQLKEREEVIKELLPTVENELHMSTCIGYSYTKLKAIIERARKSISK